MSFGVARCALMLLVLAVLVLVPVVDCRRVLFVVCCLSLFGAVVPCVLRVGAVVVRCSLSLLVVVVCCCRCVLCVDVCCGLLCDVCSM